MWDIALQVLVSVATVGALSVMGVAVAIGLAMFLHNGLGG